MTGFRIPDSFPVFLDRLGVPAAGGRLEFYEAGTSTPKSVYGDPDLTVNNGVTVLIGVDGRAVNQIWGDGAYYIRLIDADGTMIADADDVAIPGGAAATIPPLVAGGFLTNDGAVMRWLSLLLLPDPTGQAGKMLVTDGANYLLQAIPEAKDGKSDIAVTDIGFSVSDGTKKVLIQTGTATCELSGARDTSLAVVFPTPYIAEAMIVLPIPRYQGTVSPLGNAPIPHLSAKSATGFTVVMSAGERDDSSSNFNFNSPIPFDWIAVGLAALA